MRRTGNGLLSPAIRRTGNAASRKVSTSGSAEAALNSCMIFCAARRILARVPSSIAMMRARPSRGRWARTPRAAAGDEPRAPLARALGEGASAVARNEPRAPLVLPHPSLEAAPSPRTSAMLCVRGARTRFGTSSPAHWRRTRRPAAPARRVRGSLLAAALNALVPHRPPRPWVRGRRNSSTKAAAS